MTDAEWLYVILAALYAGDCLFTVRRDAVVFTSGLGRWRRKTVYCPASAADWGLVIGNPWPAAAAIITGDWPVSFGKHGALGYVARCHSPHGRIRQLACYVAYDDMPSAEADGHVVRSGGQPMAEAASERDAEVCAALLMRLKNLPVEERPRAIRQALDESLSVEAIDARIDELHRASFVCRAAGIVLVLVMFGSGAALLWWSEAFRFWPLLLATLILAHIAAVVGLSRGLKALGLRHHAGMTKHVITAALTPLASARAATIIARHALDGFHPLACAVALLTRGAWHDLAARWLRDLRHPLPPACEHPNAAACAAEAEFRELSAAALSEFLARNGFDVAAACAPPEPEEAACLAWCPRCLAQFTSTDVPCPNCAGLATIGFSR